MEVLLFLNGGREEFLLFFKTILEYESWVTKFAAQLHLLPFWLMYLWAAAIKLAMCELAFIIRPSVFCQASGFILYAPLQVIGNGLLGYFAFLALIIIFFLSVFGIPVSILLFLVLWILSMLGEIGLGLVIGYLAFDSAKKKAAASVYMLLGVAIIECLRRLPYMGYLVTMILLPIMCAGVMFTLFYNGYGKKKFYALPFWSWPERQSGTSSSIRDQVLKGLR
jgi:hypothetical protein